MKSLLKNKKIQEFIRFLLVGGSATIIHYGIYILLDQFGGININLAYTIGYGMSFIFNYIASNYFTFKTKVTLKNSFTFAIAHFFNYILQITLLNIFIFIGILSSIAPIFVFAIAVPSNYIFVRLALKPQRGILDV